MLDRLTHLDEHGQARMVDVSGKPPTVRRAVARCEVRMSPATASAIVAGTLPSPDVLATARIAGVMAAKRTPELVPLCHKILLGDVTVDFAVGPDRVAVEARVEARDRTGVEIEALTACLVAALTLYDQCKSGDRSLSIEEATLQEKSGGRTGSWHRRPDGSVEHRQPGEHRPPGEGRTPEGDEPG